MIRNSLSAGASRFAHFAGFGRASKASDEDQDRNARAEADERDEDAEEDEPEDEPKAKKGSKARRAEEEDQDDGEPKGKRGSKASDEDDDGKDAEGDDEEPKAKKGAKAKRAEEEDDEDEDADDDKREMTGGSTVASARRRERARCSAIFAHPVAAGNPELACSLAFDTTMTRQEAIAVMKGQAKRSPSQAPRSDRASRNRNLGGDAPAPTGRQAVKAGWAASFERLGVTAPKR